MVIDIGKLNEYVYRFNLKNFSLEIIIFIASDDKTVPQHIFFAKFEIFEL